MSKHCNLLHHGIAVFERGALAPCCKFSVYTKEEQFPSFTFRDYPAFKIEMEKVANEMAGGEHDERCINCWYDESLGLTSLRELSNGVGGAWDHIEANNTPQHIELRLGNYCNLECLMCWPGASTSFQTMYVENQEKFNRIGVGYPIFDNNDFWWETDEFMEFCDTVLPTAKLLHFTGGEPFMVPALPKILEKVKNPQEVNVLFVTNMTTIKQKTLDILSRFKKVVMMISLEGVGAMNDYVRYPSKWDEITSNIETIRNHFSKTDTELMMDINHTFQHTSIYSLPDLYTWADSQRLGIFFSTIAGRDFLRVDSVPEKDIEKFNNWFQNRNNFQQDKKEFIQNTIDLYKFDPKLYADYRKYIGVLDGIRGTNYDAIFNPSAP